MSNANNLPPVWSTEQIAEWEGIRAGGKLRFVLSRAIPYFLGALGVIVIAVIVCYWLDVHASEEGWVSFVLLTTLWAVYAYVQGLIQWNASEEVYHRSKTGLGNPPA